jgi:hypothetical protein
MCNQGLGGFRGVLGVLGGIGGFRGVNPGFTHFGGLRPVLGSGSFSPNTLYIW